MTVRLKLVVLVVLVALVPLVIATFTAISLHRRAHENRIRELYQKNALLGATTVRMQVEEAADGIELLAGRTVDWPELSPQERAGAVWLAYRQFEDIAIATLIDDAGEALASSFVEPARKEVMPDHPPFDLAALPEFAARIPFDAARERGLALGEAVFLGDGQAPLLPIAVRVPGTKPGSPWVVSTGLSLRRACRDLEEVSGGGVTDVFLLDGLGRAVCPPGASAPPDGRLVAAARDERLGVVRWRADGEDVLAAAADLPWGWTVLVREPASTAFAADRRIRLQSLLWIGFSLIAAVLTGMTVAAGLDRSVRMLAEAAREVTKGNFAFRLQQGADDEFGRFTRAFNEMSEQIGRRDEEIRGWNAELQRRVEDRTRELEEAQAQLLQAHKLSAVNALGAGMAHEINNPLTSVVSIAQLVKERVGTGGDLKSRDLLDALEKEAHRIRGIVQSLTALSEGARAEGFSPVPAATVVEGAIAAFQRDYKGPPIELVRNFPGESASISCRKREFERVIAELLKNAGTALKNTEEPRIVVTITETPGKLVRISVEDNGKGIPAGNVDRVFEPFFTTKDEWSAKGLGLTMAYRTVQEHNGAIKASSAGGRGTTFTVTLPVARAGTMLV